MECGSLAIYIFIIGLYNILEKKLRDDRRRQRPLMLPT